MTPSIAEVTNELPAKLGLSGEKAVNADKSRDERFALYRKLVPLVNDETVTFLNASFSPPSNLVVHEAFTRYAHQALHDIRPKAKWQANTEAARELVAKYLKTSPSSIAFTRDTTEALGGFIRSVPFSPGDNVVVLDTEHPNHVYGWLALRDSGLEIRQVPTIKETGEVQAATAETFAPYVDEKTVAIGLSSVMFHSGQWNDVKNICDTYRPHGIHVLADVTQQVGFADIDVKELGVSAAAFSLHKGLNTPIGFAVLYVDETVISQINPTPPIVGFGAVHNTRPDLLVPGDKVVYHPGTRRYEHLNLNFAAATVARAWLEFYLDTLGPKEVEAHLYSLGDALRAEAKKLGVRIVGPEDRKHHAPHLYILSLNKPGWMEHFDKHGVIVTQYRLGIRVSFGFYNNLTDVRRLAEIIKLGIEKGLVAQ